MKYGLLSATLLSLLLAACQAPTPQQPLAGHLSTETSLPQAKGEIPAPVQQTLALPKPRAVPKAETYSVVVNNVQVSDLLFALARDAKVNVDIHPGITGTVSLNAINQTLPQLLTRIAKQVDMRFELDGPNLVVMPDSPFLKHYKVDYVNMTRNLTGTVTTNTQVTSSVSGGTSGSGAAGSSGAGGNATKTEIINTSKNNFWETLEKNIKDLLRETDKLFPEGSSETTMEQASVQTSSGAAALPQGSGPRAAQTIANALQTNPTPGSASQATGNSVVRRTTFREAASVIVNPETGVITVRATSRQHEKVQEFVDRIVASSRRQVLIEATIVEVELGDGYQQGINWSRVVDGVGKSFSMTPATINSNVGNLLNPFTLTFKNQQNDDTSVNTIVNILQAFGTAKVLSSPRMSVMNNQTALLKVVENLVYFNVKADIQPISTTNNNNSGTISSGTLTTYTTTPQTVSVGLVMSVTPQISDSQAVILNVRPTISELASYVIDPNPQLTTVQNRVPQLRVREVESVMRVNNGEIAVLGGLMQDKVDWKTGRVPVLGNIPLVGELFTTRSNSATKSELVIFLRPVVIKDPSLSGDFSGYRSQLPDENFFAQQPEAQPLNNLPRR